MKLKDGDRAKEIGGNAFALDRLCRLVAEKYAAFVVEGTDIPQVRQHFKQNLRIFFAKNNLVAIALGKSAQDEQANELHKVSELLRGPSGLMFTNVKANEVQRFFAEHTEAEFAQAGAVASADISLPAGPIPAELHLHGAMEPQNFCFENIFLIFKRPAPGAIELLEEFTVCKTGDQLSADQARILKQFGHRLAQFRVRLLARWSKKKGFKPIDRGAEE
ncbi:hypothetical protein niasHT_014008 [Heterodera trifolii]|uniref:Large ribosomal subunit protein uL10-like insertion domain-containing protein n=1 Tax=Heterodera trifolii TaxID=157864 RepID=A0ABD2KXG3_9BILA